MNVTIIQIVISALGKVTKGLKPDTDGLGNKRMNGDIVEFGQSTEKSPGDLRRLVVTQTLVKYHQR